MAMGNHKQRERGRTVFYPDLIILTKALDNRSPMTEKGEEQDTGNLINLPCRFLVGRRKDFQVCCERMM